MPWVWYFSKQQTTIGKVSSSSQLKLFGNGVVNVSQHDFHGDGED